MLARTLLFTVCLGLITACGSSHTVNAPTLAPAQLQEMQTREFEATKPTMFKSVLTVFQDEGYIIEQADLETGFITAKGTAESGWGYSFWRGLQRKGGETRVTATVNSVGEQYSRVRLNFVKIETKSDLYGAESREETPIEDQEIYANVFEAIDEALFVQQAIE